ncbi:MAG TPA: sigma 54-interacting transcriptional regulator [Longimicrobium sp.]
MNHGGTESTMGILSLGSQTIVGASPLLREAVERAWELASACAPGVLLVGEAGTGKQLVARGMHYAAAPYDPFLPFNAAAIPGPLLGAELFGTHPSMIADAPPPRRGLTELAGVGTLYVADLTRLPLPLQRRLADAVRDRHIVREGGDAPVRVGCRVVAAVSSPPEAALEAGKLDEELYAALAPGRVELPPLRERPGDVRLLAEMFLGSASADGSGEPRLDEEAVATLEEHAWPGNVRELKHVVERAGHLAGDAPVRAEHLIVLHRTARSGLSNQISPPAAVIHIPSGGKPLHRVEGEAVALTLGLTRGNQSAAARILGISRPTLARKLREHGIASHGTD